MIKGLVVAVFLLFSSSCGDDFLDEKPLSFLSPENTFVDATGLETAVQRSIRGLFRQWNGDTREMMFSHNMSDASVYGATDKPDAPSVDQRTYLNPLNSRNNDAGRTRSFYYENYQHIKAANTAIDYIDIPDWPGGANDTDRNHILGQAYFMRAFFYMQLTMQFGNVAFPLTVVDEARRDYKVFYQQGIWDQMIEDLEFAEEWVKPKSQVPLGQPPKDAVRILLAKYYMLNERFAEAEDLMDAIINDGESKLFTWADMPSGVDSVEVANTYKIFGETAGIERYPGVSGFVAADPVAYLHMDKGAQKTSNPEGIWLIVNEPFVLGSQGRSARIRAWGPNFVSTNQGVTAPPNGAKRGTNVRQGASTAGGMMMQKWGRGQGFCRITNYSQYDVWKKFGTNDTQDYRHKPVSWMQMSDVVYDNADLLEDPLTAPYYLQPLRLFADDGTLLCKDTVRCWYGYPRFKMYALNQEQRPDRQDGGKMDMYIYRMGEVYLLRAEARFWQDNFGGAADDINEIRTRANAIGVYDAGMVQTDGIGAILDERNRELYAEEYRHDELVRIAVILAKTGKAYNGKTYSITGNDIEKSLSSNNFFYDRVMEKNTFFSENTPWATYTTTKYTMDPMHIWWPVYQDYIVGNVDNVLNQTTGYNGSEANIEPLTHVVQPAGAPNEDPMEAIGERGE